MKNTDPIKLCCLVNPAPLPNMGWRDSRCYYCNELMCEDCSHFTTAIAKIGSGKTVQIRRGIWAHKLCAKKHAKTVLSR